MSKDNFIIGSGLSGVSASYFLRNHKNTIIEKNNEISGRIKSFAPNGTKIEMGAQFFSKADVNVYSLVEEIGLKKSLKRVNLSNFTIKHKDRFLSLSEGPSNVFTEKEVRELEKFHSFLDKKVLKIFEMSDEDVISSSFRDWYKDNIGSESIWFIRGLVRAITFSEPKELSALYGLMVSVAFFEEAFSIEGGLDKLTDELFSISGSRLLKNSKVTELEIKENRVKRIIFDGGYSIEVKRDNSVISSIPAAELSRILPNSNLKTNLQKIKYKGCGATLIKTSKNPMDYGSGVLPSKRKGISAIIDETEYFGFDSNDMYILALRPYEVGEENLLQKTIDELVKIVPGIEGHIKDSYYFEWDFGLPVASPDFFKVQECIKKFNDIENLFLCGDYMGLPSLYACVESASNLVNKIND